MIARARDKVKYLFFIDIYARRTYHPSPRTPLAALYLFAFYYNLLEIIDTGTKNVYLQKIESPSQRRLVSLAIRIANVRQFAKVSPLHKTFYSFVQLLSTFFWSLARRLSARCFLPFAPAVKPRFFGLSSSQTTLRLSFNVCHPL